MPEPLSLSKRAYRKRPPGISVAYRIVCVFQVGVTVGPVGLNRYRSTLFDISEQINRAIGGCAHARRDWTTPVQRIDFIF